jgi:hypothetical protein
MFEHFVEQGFVHTDRACRRHLPVRGNENIGKLLEDGAQLCGEPAGRLIGHHAAS